MLQLWRITGSILRLGRHVILGLSSVPFFWVPSIHVHRVDYRRVGDHNFFVGGGGVLFYFISFTIHPKIVGKCPDFEVRRGKNFFRGLPMHMYGPICFVI
jgi:hypothetical protein